MEIWVDADLYEFSAAPDFGYRVWEGDDPEVAVVNLDDYRGQEEAISLSLIHISEPTRPY